MKREGKQHGMVRTVRIIPSSPLSPNRPVSRKACPPLRAPPTAGIFTRVPAKPTNHSKFTGKYGRARGSDCHLHPSWKSKDKVKGARKVWSTDMDLGFGGLLAWRVMGKYDEPLRPKYKVKLDSQSASDILYELYSEFGEDDHRDYTYDSNNNYTNDDGPIDEDLKCSIGSLNLDSLEEYPFISSSIRRVSSEIDEDSEDQNDFEVNGFGEIVVVEDGDDDMGFYDVAIVWEPIDGDEGWSLVGQI